MFTDANCLLQAQRQRLQLRYYRVHLQHHDRYAHRLRLQRQHYANSYDYTYCYTLQLLLRLRSDQRLPRGLPNTEATSHTAAAPLR